MADEHVALRQTLERLVDEDDVTRVEFFPTIRQQTRRWLDSLSTVDRPADVQEAIYMAALLDRLGMQDDARQVAAAVVAASGSSPAGQLALNWQAVLAATRGRYAEAEATLRQVVEGHRPAGALQGLGFVNLVAVYLQTGRFDEARRLVKMIQSEGIGTDDPRGDVLLTILDVQLERASGSPASLRSTVQRFESIVSGAISDPDLTDLDEIALLAQLALAKFDAAKADRSRLEMLEAADAATLVAQLATATVSPQDRNAVILRTRAALADFEAACAAHQTDNAGAAITTLESCHQLVCAVFGEQDRRAVTLMANIATAKLEYARMRRSVEAAREALDALDEANRKVLQTFEPAHPTAVTTIANLASAAFDIARIEDSEPGVRAAADLLELAVARVRALYGYDHPAVQVAEHELATCQALLQQGHEADEAGTTALLTRVRTRQLTSGPDFDDEYLSLEEAAAILGRGTHASTPTASTPADKGRRIVGAERQTLAKEIVRRYNSGESIRALATSTGRSYGFIHRILTESGVQLRQKGGARRRKKA